MSGLFFPCENCNTVGLVDDYECTWCLGYGDLPDTQANEKQAAQEAAHALGQLVIHASVENEDKLAEAVLTLVRAMKGYRDPWNRQ